MLDLFNLKTGGEIVDSTSTIRTIVDKISTRTGTHNVPTRSLNVNGIAVADSFEKYLNNDYISSSMFKEALITPLHYAFAKNDKSELERIKGGRDYFELGTFVHQCVLEPTKFKRAIIEPKYSLASMDGVNKGIDFWSTLLIEEFGEVEAGNLLNQFKGDAIVECGDIEKIAAKKYFLSKIVEKSSYQTVSEENYYKIQIIKRNIDKYADGIIYKLFKHSKREISFYLDDDLKYRVRPDGLQFSENIGLDAVLSVKSSATEDLRAFYYQCAKLNYDLSEAMYQDVISKVTDRPFNTTITLLLQTVPPFGVALLVWNKDDIEVGRYKFESAKQVVIEAESSGIVKGYDSYAEPGNMGLIEMELPSWNNKELLPSN